MASHDPPSRRNALLITGGDSGIGRAAAIAFAREYPSEDLVDYAATKAAIANFSKSMAKQLAPKGTRVNAVSPGPCGKPLN